MKTTLALLMIIVALALGGCGGAAGDGILVEVMSRVGVSGWASGDWYVMEDPVAYPAGVARQSDRILVFVTDSSVMTIDCELVAPGSHAKLRPIQDGEDLLDCGGHIMNAWESDGYIRLPPAVRSEIFAVLRGRGKSLSGVATTALSAAEVERLVRDIALPWRSREDAILKLDMICGVVEGVDADVHARVVDLLARLRTAVEFSSDGGGMSEPELVVRSIVNRTDMIPGKSDMDSARSALGALPRWAWHVLAKYWDSNVVTRRVVRFGDRFEFVPLRDVLRSWAKAVSGHEVASAEEWLRHCSELKLMR